MGSPNHILEHAAQFLSMKRNKRFPCSGYGEESRLEFLARGMAGVLCGASAMTGVERLRNMKHDAGSPLWRIEPGGHQYCSCWRCSITTSNAAGKLTQNWYENGLRLFMELASRVKAPEEWNIMRKRM